MYCKYLRFRVLFLKSCKTQTAITAHVAKYSLVYVKIYRENMFLFFLRHQVNMNGQAEHIPCVGHQQSKTMSHFAHSLLYVLIGLEAIWDKYRGTVEEMMNYFIVATVSDTSACIPLSNQAMA